MIANIRLSILTLWQYVHSRKVRLISICYYHKNKFVMNSRILNSIIIFINLGHFTWRFKKAEAPTVRTHGSSWGTGLHQRSPSTYRRATKRRAGSYWRFRGKWSFAKSYWHILPKDSFYCIESVFNHILI